MGSDRLLLDRKAGAVAAVADLGGIRPALACVAVRDGWAMAADGFCLAAVELPPAAPDVAAGERPLPPLLPATLVKEALSTLDRKATGVTAAPAGEGKVALAVDRGNGRGAVLEEPAPDVAYLDPTTIWPQGEPAVAVMLNVKLLRQLLDVIGKAGAYEGDGGVMLRFYGKGKAVEFRAVADDGRKTRALLMPMVPHGANTVAAERERWLTETANDRPTETETETAQEEATRDGRAA